MKKYNYKNCQSLFGYSADVHIRCKWKCQLCGCGGEPIDFDIWRQMTVEHLIGKKQGGYLYQIRELVSEKFPNYSIEKIELLSKNIEAFNTVTACQFCNSTTSRDESDISMYDLILMPELGLNAILENIENTCKEILESKQTKVNWKLTSVRDAFNEHVVSKLSLSK